MSDQRKGNALAAGEVTDARKQRAELVYAAKLTGATFEELGKRFDISKAQAWKDYTLIAAERDEPIEPELDKRRTVGMLEEFIEAHYTDFLSPTGVSKNKELVMKALDMLARLKGQYPASAGEGSAPIQIAVVGGGQVVSSNRPMIVKGNARVNG